MTSIAASTTDRFHRPGRPSTAVTVIGVLVALCCVGFAVVNVVFEITDHFADGRYAEYAAALPHGSSSTSMPSGQAVPYSRSR
jgi:hypothetical protein